MTLLGLRLKLKRWYCLILRPLGIRGQTSLKLSNSMTWSDQNCPTKGAHFAMIFLLKKCLKFCNSFINSYFIHFGYNTSYITYHEELLLIPDKTFTQLNTTLSLNMSSRSKKYCGHCGQLNTFECALSNHRKTGHPLSNHWTVGHTL